MCKGHESVRPSAPELAGCTKCSRVASRSRRQRASACARGTSPRAGEAAGRGFVWNPEVAAGPGVSVSKHVGQGSRPGPSLPAERCDGCATRRAAHCRLSHGAPQHGATGERRCLWAVAVAGLHRATAARLLKLPVRETRSHLVQVGRLEEAVLGSACMPKGASVTLVCKVSTLDRQGTVRPVLYVVGTKFACPRPTINSGR